jgi:hypothetical protein
MYTLSKRIVQGSHIGIFEQQDTKIKEYEKFGAAMAYAYSDSIQLCLQRILFDCATRKTSIVCPRILVDEYFPNVRQYLVLLIKQPKLEIFQMIPILHNS